MIKNINTFAAFAALHKAVISHYNPIEGYVNKIGWIAPSDVSRAAEWLETALNECDDDYIAIVGGGIEVIIDKDGGYELHFDYYTLDDVQ